MQGEAMQMRRIIIDLYLSESNDTSYDLLISNGEGTAVEEEGLSKASVKKIVSRVIDKAVLSF